MLNQHKKDSLNHILLTYMCGAAGGAAAFVFVLHFLGVLPPQAALFLVPTILGCHLIERAYRAGQTAANVQRDRATEAETA